MGLPRWFSGKEFTCQCKRRGFDPWIGEIPWRKAWQHTPVFSPGESCGPRSLVGCSPWGCKRVGHDLASKWQQQWRDGDLLPLVLQNHPLWPLAGLSDPCSRGQNTDEDKVIPDSNSTRPLRSCFLLPKREVAKILSFGVCSNIQSLKFLFCSILW